MGLHWFVQSCQILVSQFAGGRNREEPVSGLVLKVLVAW